MEFYYDNVQKKKKEETTFQMRIIKTTKVRVYDVK